MKTKKIGTIQMSQLAFGMWRSTSENSDNQAIKMILDQLIKLNINTIDTADIYGDESYGESERVLGSFFKEYPEYRSQFFIVTKCGILFRDVKTKHYNNDCQYIIEQVEQSLQNMNIDKIDLFLLHRPNVFMDMEEIYQAFKQLKEQKKVDQFGVSNYTPEQFSALSKYLNKRGIDLVTNQIEVNVLNPEHILNNNTNFLKGEEITPMIWSPLGGGELFTENKITKELAVIAQKYDLTIDQLAIQYLNNQGLNPVVILGTQKVERIAHIASSLEQKISNEDMFAILKLMTKQDVL